jgi:hypothetical protein
LRSCLRASFASFFFDELGLLAKGRDRVIEFFNLFLTGRSNSPKARDQLASAELGFPKLGGAPLSRLKPSRRALCELSLRRSDSLDHITLNALLVSVGQAKLSLELCQSLHRIIAQPFKRAEAEITLILSQRSSSRIAQARHAIEVKIFGKPFHRSVNTNKRDINNTIKESN